MSLTIVALVMAAAYVGVLTTLYALQDVSPGQVVVYGESLGTGVATRLATERPTAAVILDSPYTSVADIARLRYPIFPARWLVKNRFDVLSRIGSVHAPVLVLQGALDPGIPPAMGRAVYDSAASPKQLWTAPDAGHSDVLERGGEAVMAAFIARHLTGS